MKLLYINLLCILFSGISTEYLFTSELPAASDGIEFPIYSSPSSAETEWQRAVAIAETTGDFLDLSSVQAEETSDNNHAKLFTKSRLAKITELQENLLKTYKIKVDLTMNIARSKEEQKQSTKYQMELTETIVAKKEKLELVTAFMNIQLQEREFLFSGKEESEENTTFTLNKSFLNQQLEVVDNILLRLNR